MRNGRAGQHARSARAASTREKKRDRVRPHEANRGGRSAIEQGQIAAIKAAAASKPIDLSGKTNLLMLAALVRQARLLVTVDSAPMHFAAAWDTPQVVLFGPTNPFHWHPRSEFAIVLLGGHEGPVTEFKPKQRAVPMNQISTKAVIDAMEALLSAPAARAL